jgi:hypothetical protein
VGLENSTVAQWKLIVLFVDTVKLPKMMASINKSRNVLKNCNFENVDYEFRGFEIFSNISRLVQHIAPN